MPINLKLVLGRFTVAIIGVFSLAVMTSAWTSSAADRPTQKINVAYSSISGNVSPLWVTQDKGFFRKYGLEVQSILIESGTTTAQALVAGDISFASVAGPAAIQSNLRGADVVMIAGIINTLTFQLYTERGITRPDQFKGKSVGVTRYGSATDFAMRYALDKYGLDPDKEVAILQLGNQPAQLAALEAGKVQGAMLSAPTSLRAKKMGFPMLADLQMLGLEYQHTSIATSKALIKSKPNLVRDFMRAYIEGIQYAKTHRKETMEILAKYLRTDDKDILDDTYESIIQTLVPEKPYPTLKGIQIILREFGAKDPAARSARPEQFVDLSIMKELDSPWPLQPPRNRRSSKLRLSLLPPRKSPNWQPSRCPRPVTRLRRARRRLSRAALSNTPSNRATRSANWRGSFTIRAISGKRFTKPTKTF